MKPIQKAIAAVCILAASVTCPVFSAKQALTEVVEGNNKFALELYQKLHSREGNLFLSPYSISTALAMTYAGARGETERQMADVLNFPTTACDSNTPERIALDKEQFHAALSYLTSSG